MEAAQAERMSSISVHGSTKVTRCDLSGEVKVRWYKVNKSEGRSRYHLCSTEEVVWDEERDEDPLSLPPPNECTWEVLLTFLHPDAALSCLPPHTKKWDVKSGANHVTSFETMEEVSRVLEEAL